MPYNKKLSNATQLCKWLHGVDWMPCTKATNGLNKNAATMVESEYRQASMVIGRNARKTNDHREQNQLDKNTQESQRRADDSHHVVCCNTAISYDELQGSEKSKHVGHVLTAYRGKLFSCGYSLVSSLAFG
eukprot:3386470-Amphidinium_carterae.1